MCPICGSKFGSEARAAVHLRDTTCRKYAGLRDVTSLLRACAAVFVPGAAEHIRAPGCDRDQGTQVWKTILP